MPAPPERCHRLRHRACRHRGHPQACRYPFCHRARITTAFADDVIATGAMGDVITYKEDIGFQIFDAGIVLDHIGQQVA